MMERVRKIFHLVKFNVIMKLLLFAETTYARANMICAGWICYVQTGGIAYQYIIF